MLDQLVQLLEFRRDAMGQILIVSTLLAAMAMSGLVYLLADKERGRLRSALVISLTCATLLFLFGTILDALILPGMTRAIAVRHEGQIRGFLVLGRLVVYALLLGTIVLLATLGALGFLFSKKTGAWTAAAAGAAVAALVACSFYLDAVMGR